jgi:hypothetical protein
LKELESLDQDREEFLKVDESTSFHAAREGSSQARPFAFGVGFAASAPNFLPG